MVRVNSTSVQAVYAGGYPGATDAYQINFQVPAGIPSGTATLSLASGFIEGGQVTIAMQ